MTPGMEKTSEETVRRLAAQGFGRSFERHHKVYSDAMSRTQVYLGEGELELLERASRDTGASRSELIRRAVRTTFGEQGRDEKLRALQASAGSWKSRRSSGAEYVDAIRGGDLNDRLAKLGVK
jgi:Arc/MetJ-type ribon-helix-helix transcriptional regulator